MTNKKLFQTSLQFTTFITFKQSGNCQNYSHPILIVWHKIEGAIKKK